MGEGTGIDLIGIDLIGINLDGIKWFTSSIYF